MKLGIIVAMQKELEQLQGLEGENIRVVLSGIGKVNAALTAADLISDFRPDLIISIGVSGSMKPDIRQGDIVIGDRVAYHDVWCGEGNPFGKVDGLPQFFECDRATASRLHDAVPSRLGLLVSGDQFYISPKEDARILSLYPDSLAADMESGAIAQTCHIKGVPFAVARIISDTHEDDAVQQASYDSFWLRHQEAFDMIKASLLSCLGEMGHDKR